VDWEGVLAASLDLTVLVELAVSLDSVESAVWLDLEVLVAFLDLVMVLVVLLDSAVLVVLAVLEEQKELV
jgi:hypothetical protein